MEAHGMTAVALIHFTVIVILISSSLLSWQLNTLQAHPVTMSPQEVNEEPAVDSSASKTVTIPCGSGSCWVNTTANISNVYYQPKSSLPPFIHFCVTGEGGNTYYVISSIPVEIFPLPHAYGGVNGIFAFIQARNAPLATCNLTNSTSIGTGYQSVCLPRQLCPFHDAYVDPYLVGAGGANASDITEPVSASLNGTQEYVITLEAPLYSSHSISPFTSLVSLIFLIPLIRIKRRRG